MNGAQSTKLSDVFNEDWNSLTLKTSKFAPIEPVLGQRDDLPNSTFTCELFQVGWRPGDPIDLYVMRPKGVAKPPVILYLYSFPQDTERFKGEAWAMAATTGGFAAVGFVAAYTAPRTETRPAKNWFFSELQESLVTSVHDVQMILNFLEERGDLDMSRVGMFGAGSGGAIAILASAADPRIKAIDVLEPWGDWPTFLAGSAGLSKEKREPFLQPEFLRTVAHLDPVSWLPKVKARSVRIQNIRDDAWMPAKSQERLEKAAPKFAEINQFGDDAALFPMAAGGKLQQWLKDQLQLDAKPQVARATTERIHFYPAKSGKLP
jgi:hypothetical protein